MHNGWKALVQVEVFTAEQRAELAAVARQRNWGLTLLLVGWLHLLAFGFCHYLSVVCAYHEADGYLPVWLGELCGMWLIFRACGGRRPADLPRGPLELLVQRVWIGYFLLAFNLGSLNTLRGHRMFEFFPAMASLASFAFIVMSVAVNRRFIAAALVTFAAGLLMAANLLHSYLIFALAWWLVLQGIGLTLWWQRHRTVAATGQPGAPPCSVRYTPRPSAASCAGYSGPRD
jgi:hypothetical protein